MTESTPSSPRSTALAWLVCALAAAAMYGNFYVYDSIGPVADLLQQQRGFSDSQIGLLNAIYSMPNVVLIMDLARTDEERAIFKLMFARQVMAWPFAAPPGVPRERVEALRRAFAETMTDRDFLSDAAKGNFEIRPVAGDEIQKLVLDMNATPPAVLQTTVRLLQ